MINLISIAMAVYINNPYNKLVCQKLDLLGHQAYSETRLCTPLPEPDPEPDPKPDEEPKPKTKKKYEAKEVKVIK